MFVAANLTYITPQVLAMLNANTNYAATSSDDKFTDNEIQESIFQADEQVFTAIAETPGHYYRVDLMSASADITAQGGEIPSHIGPIGEVTIRYVSTDTDYKPANPMNRKEIEIYQRDTDSYLNAAHNSTGTLVAGYYDPQALADGVAFFTGYAMRARIAVYNRGAVLQSPEVYASAICAGALAWLFTKDGFDPQIGNYYAGEFDKRLNAIRQNAMPQAA